MTGVGRMSRRVEVEWRVRWFINASSASLCLHALVGVADSQRYKHSVVYWLMKY
jgi:hypothetical protein